MPEKEVQVVYRRVTIDLSTARTKALFSYPGDTILVEYIDGECDIHLDDPHADLIEIDKVKRIITKPAKFSRFYVTNAAQSGKTARLYIGSEASFEAETEILGKVGILDAADIRINPAKEDGNLASIEGHLSHKYAQIINADETVAQSISLDTKGSRLLEVYASASTATTFTFEVSHDNVNWITWYTSPAAETEYGGDKTMWNGYRYVKLSSAAAGVAGDTVSLYLGAK